MRSYAKTIDTKYYWIVKLLCKR